MKKTDAEGSVLVLTVIIFAALLMLGVTAVNTALAGYRMRRTSTGITADYYVAESGIEEARASVYVIVENGIVAGVNASKEEILGYDDDLLVQANEKFAVGDTEDFAVRYPYIKISDGMLSYDESYINKKAETCFFDTYKNYVKESVAKYGPDKLTYDRDGHMLSGFKDKLVIRILNMGGKPLSTVNFDAKGQMNLSVSSSYGSDGGMQRIEAIMTVSVPDYKGPYYGNTDSQGYDASQLVWTSEVRAIR